MLNRSVERAPYIDDTDAVIQEGFGFGGEVVVHASCGGGFGLVDVYPGDRFAVATCAADGVVEEEDALCARDVLQEKFFHFRVVVLLDGCVIREVFLG